MQRLLLRLLLEVGAATTVLGLETPEVDTISLDGPWSFELDGSNEGLRGGFARRPSFAHTIVVPGVSIGAAGFGPSTEQKHHEYTGVSWNLLRPKSSFLASPLCLSASLSLPVSLPVSLCASVSVLPV